MNLEAGTAGVWLPEWIPSERYLDFARSVCFTSWETPDRIFDRANETKLLLEHLSHPANVVLMEGGPFLLSQLPSWAEDLTYYWKEDG